jgi:hypothetical protein
MLYPVGLQLTTKPSENQMVFIFLVNVNRKKYSIYRTRILKLLMFALKDSATVLLLLL